MKLITVLFVLFLASCGSEETVYKKSPGGGNAAAYSFADMQGYCFDCHNSSAPAIPLDEAGFQASAKVRARIADGTMPPPAVKGDFDLNRALAYMDGISEDDPTEASGY